MPEEPLLYWLVSGRIPCVDPDFKHADDRLIRLQWKAWNRSRGIRLQRVTT
jgi:hypothetical protein